MICEIQQPRIKRFAEIFVRLWYEAHNAGIDNPRVGRRAALMAGYGDKSWSEVNALQAADVVYNKLAKRPDVVEYFRQRGIEKIGRRWQRSDKYYAEQ